MLTNLSSSPSLPKSRLFFSLQVYARVPHVVVAKTKMAKRMMTRYSPSFFFHFHFFFHIFLFQQCYPPQLIFVFFYCMKIPRGLSVNGQHKALKLFFIFFYFFFNYFCMKMPVNFLLLYSDDFMISPRRLLPSRRHQHPKL